MGKEKEEEVQQSKESRSGGKEVAGSCQEKAEQEVKQQQQLRNQLWK